MAVAIPGDEEETIAVTRKRHTRHPDASLPASGALGPDVGLGDQRSCFRHELCDDLLRGDIDTHHDSGVVEQVAVAAESAVHHIPSLEKRLDSRSVRRFHEAVRRNIFTGLCRTMPPMKYLRGSLSATLPSTRTGGQRSSRVLTLTPWK